MNKENKEKVKKNVCSICGRPTHKKSKYCIFHAIAEEKTEDEFIEALKEYINEIKEENKEYDFEGFIFIGDIDFKKDLSITIFKNANFSGATFLGDIKFNDVTFLEDAKFNGATFQGDTTFWGTTFQGYINFRGTTFQGLAYFIGATFQEYADFRGKVVKEKEYADFDRATFQEYADFDRATFQGDAKFQEATFQENATFKEATFQESARFWGATFQGKVNFEEATFRVGANFYEATFQGDVNFRVKTIKWDLIFSNAVFNQGKTLEINTLKIMNEVEIDFARACLENVYLELILGKKTLIYFTTKKILRNIVIKGNQIKNHILQEKRKKFEQAKEVYLLLKNNFHSIGRYEDESWALKKEKDMERKSYFHFKSLHKWLWSFFINAIYGYGERPLRVIVSAIVIITIFTFIYMNFGLDANSELDNLPKYNIFKEVYIGIQYGDLLIRLKNISLEQLKNCLYFSVVTFTTLGLGDFRPFEGWGRIFVGLEAFIGAFMMALFVYTFARRTGGR